MHGDSLKGESKARNWFEIENPRDKIDRLPEVLGCAFHLTEPVREIRLGRNVNVVAIQDLPPKIGLSHPRGQARLLHDLGNIELQAMELAVRTLCEFTDAPEAFRNELADIALSEGKHLGLCLDGLEAQGVVWGEWDVHLSLWNTVAPNDSLTDRILIVHRYLEGSGLDAGDSILRRLAGCADKRTRKAVQTIVDEEIGHVAFGSYWYRKIAESLHLDPEKDFAERIQKIAKLAPRREKLAREKRLQAGFTDFELNVLEELLKT